MKQSVVGSLVVGFVLSSTCCFAQFAKAPAMAARNAAKIQRYTMGKVALATHPVFPVACVRDARLPGNIACVKVGLPAMPVVGNNVNASYLNQHKRLTDMYQASRAGKTPQEIQEIMAQRWTGVAKTPGIGKAFYEDQSSLAQDLNTFYEGAGITVTAPGGEIAKLYALPVDGILYKPSGYKDPVVLTAAEDFVVYYPRTKTGQLVQNKPEVLEIFNRPANSGTFNEVVTLGGKEFEMPMGEPDWGLLDGEKPVEPSSTPVDDVDFEEVK